MSEKIEGIIDLLKVSEELYKRHADIGLATITVHFVSPEANNKKPSKWWVDNESNPFPSWEAAQQYFRNRKSDEVSVILSK